MFNSVPEYFPYNTTSPAFTSIASSFLAAPVRTTSPFRGFSLAESGIMIPLEVFSSAASGLTKTLPARIFPFKVDISNIDLIVKHYKLITATSISQSMPKPKSHKTCQPICHFYSPHAPCQPAPAQKKRRQSRHAGYRHSAKRQPITNKNGDNVAMRVSTRFPEPARSADLFLPIITQDFSPGTIHYLHSLPPDSQDFSPGTIHYIHSLHPELSSHSLQDGALVSRALPATMAASVLTQPPLPSRKLQVQPLPPHRHQWKNRAWQTLWAACFASGCR